MKMFRLLRTQCRQISPIRLVVLVIGVALLHLASVAGFIEDHVSAWYLVYNSTVTGISFFTLFCLPALCFSFSFANEYQHKALPYWIMRTGIARYTVDKLLISNLAGFLVVFFGMITLALVCCLIDPWYTMSVGTDLYDAMMANGHVIAGTMMFMIDHGLSGAIYAAMGLFASFWIPNPYVAVTTPIALYLTLSRIVAGSFLEVIFNPGMLPYTVHEKPTALEALFDKIGLTVVVLLIMCALGIKKMNRRVQCEGL